MIITLKNNNLPVEEKSNRHDNRSDTEEQN